MRYLSVGLVFWGAAALAETSMTGPGFEAVTEGRTMQYFLDGLAYGKEQHLSGRRVIWAHEGGVCRYGTWYVSGGAICFDYEHREDDQCWRYEALGAGVAASQLGVPDPLRITGRSVPGPIDCPDPEANS